MESNLFPVLLNYASRKETDTHDYRSVLIESNLDDLRNLLNQQSSQEVARHILSTQNYIQRSQWMVSETVEVKVGDVCFIDFGQAYRHEAGYQHFGFVLSKLNGKVFVIPMTSNSEAYRQAYDENLNPKGKPHLMRFGQICGLNRPSVLFLNDCKFISPSRIIEIKGHLDESDQHFIQIQQRVARCLFEGG